MSTAGNGRSGRAGRRDWRELGARVHDVFPSLRPLVREASLFLALALGMISLDSAEASSTLWWPLPLILLAATLALRTPGGPCPHWRHWGWIGALALALFFRAMLSLYGAIPALGLREAQNLSVIFMLATGLWIAASASPSRTLAAWTAAALLGWLTLLFSEARPPRLDPALWATGLSALVGVVLLLRLREPWRALQRVQDWDSRAVVPQRRRVLRPASAALVAGALLGMWLAGRTPEVPLLTRAALEHGQQVLGALWSRSVLLGWGLTSIDRLVDIQGQPRPVLAPPWGGIVGFLAGAGLGGLVLAAALGALIVRHTRALATQRNAMALLAGAALVPALFLIGWWIAGGPRSAVFLLVLAGWSALALTTAARRSRSLPGMIRWMPSVYGAAGVAALILMLAMPAMGTAMWRTADAAQMAPDRYRQRLVNAQARNPFDPRIPLAQAQSWKLSMQSATSWSESMYQRVLGLYRRAAELDPYDPLIVLRMAQFQAESPGKGDKAALETVRLGLERMPNAWELQDWQFLTALKVGDTALAYQVLDRGLRAQPERADWWRRRHALAQMQGQTLLAEQALAVALTAEPGDPRLQLASWRAAHGVVEATPNLPPVALPGSD